MCPNADRQSMREMPNRPHFAHIHRGPLSLKPLKIGMSERSLSEAPEAPRESKKTLSGTTFCTGDSARQEPEFGETNFERPNFGPELLGRISDPVFSSRRGDQKIHPQEAWCNSGGRGPGGTPGTPGILGTAGDAKDARNARDAGDSEIQPRNRAEKFTLRFCRAIWQRLPWTFAASGLSALFLAILNRCHLTSICCDELVAKPFVNRKLCWQCRDCETLANWKWELRIQFARSNLNIHWHWIRDAKTTIIIKFAFWRRLGRGETLFQGNSMTINFGNSANFIVRNFVVVREAPIGTAGNPCEPNWRIENAAICNLRFGALSFRGLRTDPCRGSKGLHHLCRHFDFQRPGRPPTLLYAPTCIPCRGTEGLLQQKLCRQQTFYANTTPIEGESFCSASKVLERQFRAAIVP